MVGSDLTLVKKPRSNVGLLCGGTVVGTDLTPLRTLEQWHDALLFLPEHAARLFRRVGVSKINDQLLEHCYAACSSALLLGCNVQGIHPIAGAQNSRKLLKMAMAWASASSMLARTRASCAILALRASWRAASSAIWRRQPAASASIWRRISADSRGHPPRPCARPPLQVRLVLLLRGPQGLPVRLSFRPAGGELLQRPLKHPNLSVVAGVHCGSSADGPSRIRVGSAVGLSRIRGGSAVGLSRIRGSNAVGLSRIRGILGDEVDHWRTLRQRLAIDGLGGCASSKLPRQKLNLCGRQGVEVILVERRDGILDLHRSDRDGLQSRVVRVARIIKWCHSGEGIRWPLMKAWWVIRPGAFAGRALPQLVAPSLAQASALMGCASGDGVDTSVSDRSASAVGVVAAPEGNMGHGWVSSITMGAPAAPAAPAAVPGGGTAAPAAAAAGSGGASTAPAAAAACATCAR